MRSYIERAKDFIQQIFPYLDGEWTNPYDVDCNVDAFNEDYNRKVVMRHGIARIALITSDYVVKFDFDEDECSQVGGCQAEVELYAEAQRDGFDYLFAQITHYSYNNHDFYIMPRIRGINGNRWYHADHFMTDEENDWCDEHSLSDLHGNNYGFRNGKICIIDYACHLEETDGSSYEYTTSEVSES